MPRLRRSLAFGIVIAAVAGLAPAEEPREGLVVIAAPPAGSLAEAGLQPGDILLSWQRGGAAGLLRWPSGLAEAETEQAPWGVVRLAGRRGEQPMTWQMPAVRWNLHTRPALSPHLLTLYQEGAERAAARDLEAAADSWLTAVDVATRADDKPRAAWFLGELGRAWAARSRWEEADRAYEGAIRRVEGGGMAAHLLREWGGTFVRRELWERAESCYQRALALAPSGSLAAGRDLALLASIATHRGDLDRAERLYEQALATRRRITVLGPYLTRMIREEIAGFALPQDLRGSDTEIADLRRRLQQLRDRFLAEAGAAAPRQAEGAARTGSATTSKPSPEVKKEPSVLDKLMLALAQAEREDPGSLAVSDHWQGLGTLAYAERDLVGAEVAWLRALDLREKLAPATLRETRTLHDLGRLHLRAKRSEPAVAFLCRAAGVLDRMAPLRMDAQEIKAALGTTMAAVDRDCVSMLVETGRTEDAFLALERSYARAVDLPLSPELARRKKQIEEKRDSEIAQLARLSTARDRDVVDLGLGRVRSLAVQREEIARPLSLRDLRAALAPGTVLLAWSAEPSPSDSLLFVVQPEGVTGPGLEVFTVPARTTDLRNKVRAVAVASRLLVLHPGGASTPDSIIKLIWGGPPAEVKKEVETIPSATAWTARQIAPSLIDHDIRK